MTEHATATLKTNAMLSRCDSWPRFQIELTNYKHDGSWFKNYLTVLPVRDVNGLYCYSIAAMVCINNAGREYVAGRACVRERRVCVAGCFFAARRASRVSG